MVAPLAGLALLAPGTLDAGVKMASSVTAQISAALGHPVLHRQVIERRTTARGEKVTTTEASVPAWLVVGGGALFLLALSRPPPAAEVPADPVTDPLGWFWQTLRGWLWPGSWP